MIPPFPKIQKFVVYFMLLTRHRIWHVGFTKRTALGRTRVGVTL